MPRHLFISVCNTLVGIVWLCLSAAAHAQIGDLLGKPTYKSDQVTAQLLIHAPQGVAPGHPLWAGLQLQHATKWHTYWLNSGDSGLPTQLTWQLPQGITAGDITWPTPKKFPLGTLANYGYDGEVLLAVPLTVSPQWQGKHLAIGLTASWLACRTECIPEEASLQTTIAAHMPTSLHGQLFEAAAGRAPKTIANNQSESAVEDQFLSITVGNLPPSWQGRLLEVFPHAPGIIEPGAPWTQAWQNQTWSARLPLSAFRADSPREMTWVLANNQNLREGEAAQAGAQLTSPVEGTWPTANTPATITPALEAALAAGNQGAPEVATPVSRVVNTPAPTLSGWLLAVVGAFVGGLLLNLMPCVFPEIGRASCRETV